MLRDERGRRSCGCSAGEPQHIRETVRECYAAPRARRPSHAAPLRRRGWFDASPQGDDDPGHKDDPKAPRIPLDSRIGRARPRTPESEDQRSLRRAYNHSRGIDESGNRGICLIFAFFQRNPQFAAAQRRLAGESLVDYVVPTGGGRFFLPPGARDKQDRVGSHLLL